MTVTVNVPAGEKALLIVTFSGVSSCVGTGFCYVRVRLDGQADPPPGPVIFDSTTDGTGFETNSMQWVAGPVSAGAHTVRVDYRISGTTGGFTLYQRTLTVLRSRVSP